MDERIDRDRFIALLTERFPEVAASIPECSRGLVDLEMSALAAATQSAINAWDRETTRRYFGFVDEVYQNAGPEVANAVLVSYRENLQFDGRLPGPAKARDLLPPHLRDALAAVEAYWALMADKRASGPGATPDCDGKKRHRGERLPRGHGR